MRRRRNRQYTEMDKATALALLLANEGNILRTAREVGMPQSTLRKWSVGEGVNGEVAKKCEQKKEDLADLFERVTRAYLAKALEPALVDKTAGKDAVMTAAIATDKAALLRGKGQGGGGGVQINVYLPQKEGTNEPAD